MGKKTVVLYSLYISDDEVCNWMNTETPHVLLCSIVALQVLTPSFRLLN